MNIVAFFKKISWESSESPFRPTREFPGKYFIPTLISKLEEVTPPFLKGGFNSAVYIDIVKIMRNTFYIYSVAQINVPEIAEEFNKIKL